MSTYVAISSVRDGNLMDFMLLLLLFLFIYLFNVGGSVKENFNYFLSYMRGK